MSHLIYIFKSKQTLSRHHHLYRHVTNGCAKAHYSVVSHLFSFHQRDTGHMHFLPLEIGLQLFTL